MSVTESHEPATLVTKQEAVAVLKVSLRTVDRYIADGTLEGRRLSARATRITRASLDALVQGREAA